MHCVGCYARHLVALEGRGRRLFTSRGTAFHSLVLGLAGLDHVIKRSLYDDEFCDKSGLFDRIHHGDGELTRFS